MPSIPISTTAISSSSSLVLKSSGGDEKRSKKKKSKKEKKHKHKHKKEKKRHSSSSSSSSDSSSDWTLLLFYFSKTTYLFNCGKELRSAGCRKELGTDLFIKIYAVSFFERADFVWVVVCSSISSISCSNSILRPTGCCARRLLLDSSFSSLRLSFHQRFGAMSFETSKMMTPEAYVLNWYC